MRGRRRWRELLELAQHRQLDLIVVQRLDHAFRSVLDGATTLAHLRVRGCGLRSLQEPWIDATTPIGEAMFHSTIAWARAQYDGRRASPRIAHLGELHEPAHARGLCESTRASAVRR